MNMLASFLAGPLGDGRSFPGKLFGLLLVLVLTALTQVGGVVLWLAQGLGNLIAARSWLGRRALTGLLFLAFYLTVTFAVVPMVAPRVQLPVEPGQARAYGAVSPLYLLLNRTYVKPEVEAVLAGLSGHMAKKFPGTVVRYLDGGFPFLDRFPMLPHLSHGDGRKLDLALFYKEKATGEALPDGGAWPVGYWAYAPALHLGTPVEGSPWTRWDMAPLQGEFEHLALDEERTAEMVRWLGRQGAVEKVFLEPYLARHLGVNARYAGDGAARHDDHLHFQVRRQ